MKRFLVGFLLASLVFGGAAIIAGDITSTGWSQKDVVTYFGNINTIVNNIKTSLNTARTNPPNANFVSGALAVGDNTTRFKTAAAISFRISGSLYNKAATDNITATACAAQADNTYVVYQFTITSAGAITVTKGSEVATDVSVLPAVPSGSVAIGAVKIATSGGTFTMGTTALTGATGCTYTWYNFIGPSEAQYDITAISDTSLTLTGL